jgi:hypothetical protein
MIAADQHHCVLLLWGCLLQLLHSVAGGPREFRLQHCGCGGLLEASNHLRVCDDYQAAAHHALCSNARRVWIFYGLAGALLSYWFMTPVFQTQASTFMYAVLCDYLVVQMYACCAGGVQIIAV